MLNRLRNTASLSIVKQAWGCKIYLRSSSSVLQKTKPCEKNDPDISSTRPINSEVSEVYSTRPVQMVMSRNEPVVLSFDEVPGPKSLKYLAFLRHYLSQVGTHLTAGALSLGFTIGSLINNKSAHKKFSTWFDEYGPVVRFVSPIGHDVVLINHPAHIKKVFNMEGEFPVRSTLDCLDKYRTEHRNHFYSGLFNVQGEEWVRQRAAVCNPLNQCLAKHLTSLEDICNTFCNKLYKMRNYQDEVNKDLYQEVHKWTFDCMGLIIFAKKFSMLQTDMVYSQCDMSWFYHSLEKATGAMIKCESGLKIWHLFPTPAWNSLVKYCDNLENLIGKLVLEAEQRLAFADKTQQSSLTYSMLCNKDKLKTEDVTTLIMDMLLLGVNTISTTTSFLLYNLATHHRVQKNLYEELSKLRLDLTQGENALRQSTPYLQACIRETLRLVPPIPVITRILPKNITLDKYNIPSGTMVIMSTQDASLKEINFDDAAKFCPERWLNTDPKDYNEFASIPFGFGARKCLGKDVAETMISLITINIMQRYKLEYHYGEIQPIRTFISRPNKPLRLRFIDRSEK